MGRALPQNGALISLEVEPRHANIARRFIAQAGLADRVEVRVGPALEALPLLAGGLLFDMAFIDADKGNYPSYLDWALRLVRPGGLIVADNVLRDGDVLEENATDEATKATQAYNDRVASDPRLEAVVLFTRNGTGGVDGVSVARVTENATVATAGYYRE
jgi:predicted O-methyltransferase YrrM